MRFNHLRRRQFITLLGGAGLAWPLAARAQQGGMPVVGYLEPGFPEAMAHRLAAFRKGLRETGYVEGRNVAIEYRWGQDQYDRLPELAVDLVRRGVAVIATPGSIQGALAAKAATTAIPIVFSTGADPVKVGLVGSLNRPGGNLTGVSSMTGELGAKQFGLLQELLPGATRFAVLTNSRNAMTEPIIEDLRTAALAIGRQIDVFNAGTNRDIDTVFASLVQKRADALLVSPDPLFANRRVQLVTLATYHRVPAIYISREFAEASGLMSYGTSQTDMYRQVGIYVGRILKGEKPADLPVLRATKFELVINLQTAKTLPRRAADAARACRRGHRVRRRELIALLGGVATTWPLTARAQQPAMPVVGFLNSASPAEREPFVAAFRQGLKEIGYLRRGPERGDRVSLCRGSL
jgi:putative tryptophan/tyrosine transport system substrate-binding protein